MIKEKELVIGNLYIKKDGIVVVYLGKTFSQKFLFYKVAQLNGYLDSSSLGVKFELYNKDIQLKYITPMIKEEMQTTLDKRCVVGTKTFNNYMWKYPDLSFTQEELRLWLQKNELLGLSLFKDLATLQGKEEVNLYVKTKDLIPGHVYYSGDGWRAIYVYLGRDEDKNFLWYFVGNVDIMKKASYYAMLSKADKTKANKKVKDVWNYALDEYVCASVKQLGQEKFVKQF